MFSKSQSQDALYNFLLVVENLDLADRLNFSFLISHTMVLIITVVFIAHVFIAHSRPLAIPPAPSLCQYPMPPSGLRSSKTLNTGLRFMGNWRLRDSI